MSTPSTDDPTTLDTDGWQVVEYTNSHLSTSSHERKTLREWALQPGHWSGSGKHTSSHDLKFKIHVDSYIGHGGHAVVEKVVVRSVCMARKRIRGSRKVPAERLREEANIMEKLACHRHIVELVGSYTIGRSELCLLTYPAAVCDLHFFLADVEDLRAAAAASSSSTENESGLSHNNKDATWDAGRRLEMLGFKGIVTEKGTVDTRILSTATTFLESILGCVTEAVHFVHANGVRHQDLKPRNILLSPRQVYLADFGISRDLKDATHSLTEGFPGGTPHYLAPEVAQGEAHHMSPADIYSLGCVFLVVVSILYGAPHGQYETVMSERDPYKKKTGIAKYLDELRPLALKSGRADDAALTCSPRHLLGLTERMLSSDPCERPTAKETTAALHDLGGLSQVYHGRCCRKDTAFLNGLIDAKLAALQYTALSQTSLIKTLEAQTLQQQAQIESLTETRETYQARLEKERKHAVESYEKTLERKNRDLDAAYTRIRVLERELERAASASGNGRTGSGGRRTQGGQTLDQQQQQQQHMRGKIKDLTTNTKEPRAMKSPHHIATSVIETTNDQQARLSPPHRRRSSKIPLPERPSTPLRRSPQGQTSTSSSRDTTLASSSSSSFLPSSGTNTLVNSIASDTSFEAKSTTDTVATSASASDRGSVGGRSRNGSTSTIADTLESSKHQHRHQHQHPSTIPPESPSLRKRGDVERATAVSPPPPPPTTTTTAVKKTWAEMLRKQTTPPAAAVAALSASSVVEPVRVVERGVGGKRGIIKT